MSKLDLARREDMSFNGKDDLGPHNPVDSKGMPLYSSVSLTRQEFVDECDITKIMNNIMRGVPQPQGTRELRFIDTSASPDYHQAMNLVAQAQQEFAQLPAKARDYFMNNPANFLNFMADEDNYDKAAELGLIDPAKAAARADQIASAAAASAAKQAAKTVKKEDDKSE